MREKHLLPTGIKCCDELCNIITDTSSDDKTFRSKICMKKYSVHTGSFFSKSKLNLGVLLQCTYYFTKGRSVKHTSEDMEGKMSKK